jgi:hypothetical protein
MTNGAPEEAGDDEVAEVEHAPKNSAAVKHAGTVQDRRTVLTMSASSPSNQSTLTGTCVSLRLVTSLPRLQ